MADIPKKLGVSILICTYNGASRLEPTLSALLHQKDTAAIPWEIVLIDNASSDDTSAVAEKIMSENKIPFRIINEPKPGRDNALRTGFQEVVYEFVCNVDDDTWVCDNYVSLVWEIMKDRDDIAVCGGHGVGEFEVPAPAWLKPIEASLAIGKQCEKTGYITDKRKELYGACAVYRKSLWFKLQEINFKFFLSGRKGKKLNSGEDSELCLAWKMLGYKLYYDERINFRHYMPSGRLTWPYFRKLFRAFGRSDLVLVQYFAALGSVPKNRLFIYTNYFMLLAYTLYYLVKRFPIHVYELLFRNEGNESVLLFGRHMALFIELLTNKKRFSAVKQALSKHNW